MLPQTTESLSLSLSQQNRAPDLSIVVVSYNTRELTRACLENLCKCGKGLDMEVILVDNHSLDGSVDMVQRKFPWVIVISLKINAGFAGGSNVGICRARGRYILLLNSDAFVRADTLKTSLNFMERHSKVGVLGCQLTDSEGGWQPSARMLPSLLNKLFHVTGLAGRFPKSRLFGRQDFTWWNHSGPKNVGWVVGAYFMIRKETLNQIGGLDDRYFLYFEEIDFCRTASKAGWDVVMHPKIRVIHLGGQSSAHTGKRISAKGKQLETLRLTSEYRYYRKFHGWAGVLATASVEFFWNLAIYLKHLFMTSPHSLQRRKEALGIMRNISAVLVQDKLGAGFVKGIIYESH